MIRKSINALISKLVHRLLAITVAAWWLAMPASANAQETAVPCNAEPTDMAIGYGNFVSCSIGSFTDSDLFRFTGNANEVVIIYAIGLSGGIEPCFNVRPPGGGAPIAASPCSSLGQSVQTLQLTLPSTGSYTIQLSDLGANAQGNYQLMLERLFPSSPTAETIAGFGVTQTKTIDLYGDNDFYLFSSGGSENLVITTVALSGGLEPCFALYDPTGAQIGASPCSSLGQSVQRLEVVLTTPGIHTLRVQDLGANAFAGDYQLTVECLFGACVAGETRVYLDTASIRDFSGNGQPEVATLQVHRVTQSSGAVIDRARVLIKDGTGGPVIRILTFHASTSFAKAMAVLPDLPGPTSNGIDEIAVLATAASGNVVVQIRDADTGDMLSHLAVLNSDWVPLNLSVLPDMNGNGASEIAVLAAHKITGKRSVRIRDALTGDVIVTIPFPD